MREGQVLSQRNRRRRTDVGPACGISIFPPAYLSLSNPCSLPQLPHHFASLNAPMPFPPLISHLVFLPCFHTLLPQPSLLDQSSLRLGRISISGLLCDLKAFSCPLCAFPTISRFLSPAGAPWSLVELPGSQRTGTKTERRTGGSSSALCQWPPPQPQGCAGSLQAGEGLIAVA